MHPALRFCRGALPSVLLGITVLSRRFAIGLRSALWFCCGVLPSVHAWPCGSVAALCLRFTLGLAVLLRRFAFGSRLALRFCCGALPSVLLGITVLLRRFAFGSRLSFSRCEKETACDVLRSYSTGSRSPFVRSRAVLRLSAFVGSLRVCAFFYGDLDGVTGDARNGGTGLRELTARLLCLFAWSYWS